MSRIGKTLIVLAALVGLLAAALAVFLLTFDANRYRGAILAQLSRSVNRPVEATDLKLELVPLRLRLDQVRILEDPTFAGEEFIRAQSVQLDLSLASLLRGQPQVLALELNEATVFLRQQADGRWNFASVAAAAGPAAPSAQPAAAPVRDWRVHEGTIAVERAGQPALRLTGVELAVSELSSERPFPFRLAVSTAADSRLSAIGRVGPIDFESPARTPLEAEIELEDFRPAALSSLLPVPPALARLGALGGRLALSVKPDGLTLAGKLILPGRSPGEEVELDFTAAAPTDVSRIELREAIIQHAGARVTASGSVGVTPPTAGQFHLALATSNGDLAALKQIPPRLGFALPANLPAATGRLTATLSLSGTRDAWQLAGTATVRELTLPLAGLPQPLTVPALELTVEPERITAAPFAVAPQPGLSLTVAANLEDYRGRARLAARITGGEVPLEPLLALATQLGKNPLRPGQRLSGRVRPDLEVSGPLAEPAQLGYQGTLALRDLLLVTPELPQPVRMAGVELSLDPRRLSAPPFTAQLGEKLRAEVRFRLDNYQTAPLLEARLATEQADVEALLALVRALGTDLLAGGKASGRLSATVDLSGPLGESARPMAVRGQAQLAGISFQPAQLATPLRLEQASLEFSRERLELTHLRLAAAGGKFEGRLRVEDFDAPQAEFDLRGDTLDVEALQAMFATPPSPPLRQRSLWQHLVPTVHAQEKPAGWFARLRGRGRLAFERVKHGTFTLAPFSSPVVIANQVVTCDPLEFGLYDGGGRGRLAVDLRGPEPLTEFDGLLRGVDANKLLSENTDSKDRLSGRLGGTLAVRFAGSERARMQRSATGQGQLTLVNGRLGHINLSREVVLLGELTGLRYEERDTPIEDMTTNFEISEGWVRTRDLTLRTPDLTMNAAGGFSFEDALAFEATATFTPEATQRMSSRSPLGGLAGNIFTDDQGRAVVPFLIGGSFARPKFSLDSKRLLEMRLGRERSRPGGTLRDILDRIRQRPPPPP